MEAGIQAFFYMYHPVLAISAHKIARIIYFFVKITKKHSTLRYVNAILIQLFNVLKQKIKAKIQERR